MRTTVGIFTSRQDAETAVEHLASVGFSTGNINLLAPGASKQEIESIPTIEMEPPGSGKGLGGLLGAGLGIELSIALSAIIPGIGPVVASGLLASVLLGVLGAAGGAAAGGALDAYLAEGLPVDELYLYADAVGQGRTVVIVLADDRRTAEAAREILIQAGAESLDAARKDWWVGLRDAEALQYTGQGGDFTADEPNYRRGFEASLSIKGRGKSYQEALEFLKESYPDVYDRIPFRRGYERGHGYYQRLQEKFEG